MAKAKSKKFENFKLRLSLLGLWFKKNILVFLQIIAIVLCILMFTGAIPEDFPILGDLFGPLIRAIREVIAEKEINSIMTFFSVAISVLTTIGMFMLKVKTLAISDIKSDKMKYALVKANLYFNENGRLVKRVENITQTDIDGDGKIDTVIDNTSGGLLGGIKRTVDEFITIVNADFNDEEKENTEVYQNALKDANLEKTQDALEQTHDEIIDGAVNYAESVMTYETEDKIEENKNDEEKKNTFKGIKILLSGWFMRLKEKIASWRAARAAKKAEKKIEKEQLQKKEEVVKTETVVEQKPVVVETKKESDIDAFLKRIGG